MWDLENCTLEQIKRTLREIQSIYNLSDIFIVTDNDKTYRAWCFSKIDFGVYLHILVDCLPILDYNVFYYTIKRRKATLRISSKKADLNRKLLVYYSLFYALYNLMILLKKLFMILD
jgi:hypothetical protein